MQQRKYVIKEEDRQFLDYIPPASILLAGVIFLFGTFLAILLYETPNGKYDFFKQFFSELGVRRDYIEVFSDGTTEKRYAPPHPDIFNFTLVLSGILMIPFFTFSFRQMRNESLFSTIVLWIAIVGGVLTGPMLIGVGIFDLSFPVQYFWQEHGFWVALLYILITIVCILWYIMLIFARDLPYKKTKLIWVDYVLLFLLALFTIINLLDGFKLVKTSNIPVLNAFPIQTYQKLIAYLFFGYFGLVVGVRLTKTKYDNTPVIHSKNKHHYHVKGSDSWYCTNCGEANPENTELCKKCRQALI